MRKIKIFTNFHKYNLFLDVWLDYYTKIVDQDDITILHLKITDFDLVGYLKEEGYSGISVEDREIGCKLHKKQWELFDNCDVVVYSDLDEIIYHRDLLNILNDFESPYLTTTGFEIIHNFGEELPIDMSKKIMDQRSWGIFSQYYNKSLILKDRFEWGRGNHTLYDKDTHKPMVNEVADGLYLVHLNRFDFSSLLNLNRENTKFGIYSKYWHQVITDEEKLKKYFVDNFFPKLVRIPDDIKLLNI